MEVVFADNRMKGALFLPSRTEAVKDFMQWLLKLLTAYDFQAKDASAIRLAVEAALLDAVKHGDKIDPSKHVHVDVAIGINEFRIQIMDEGEGFDPEEIFNSITPENLNRPNGRSLWLVRRCMHEVQYDEKGNEVTLIRHGSSARPPVSTE